MKFSYSDPSPIIDKLIRGKWDNPHWLHLRLDSNRSMILDFEEDLIVIEQLKDHIQMMPHQIKTAIKVKNIMKNCAILADEVGLGKTIEAGILIKENICRNLVKKILILTPASLTMQWKEEMTSKFSEEFIIANTSDSNFKGFEYHDKIIVSLDTAKRGLTSERIKSFQWDMLVIDEAHRLKNSSSLAYHLVKGIITKYLLLLTATPIQNNLKELYNLINLVKPGLLGTWHWFKKDFVKDSNIRVVKNHEKLQTILSQVMVRTRKIETSQYLQFPKRFPETHRVKFTPKEKDLYDKVTQFIRKQYFKALNNEDSRESLIFSLLIFQRQLASSTAALGKALQNKINSSSNPQEILELTRLLNETYDITYDAKITELLNIISKSKSKIIIFTTFLETQRMISRALNNRNFKNSIFSGALTSQEKKEILQRFEEDDRILISTETGGEGLNLQFCNVLINYDIPWNPMKIEQRIGRIHRIGQKQNVYIHNLINQDTVEDYILSVLYEKIMLFELTIGDLELIFGDEVEYYEKDIFDLYMKADNMSSFKNKLGVLKEKTLNKKNLAENFKDFDRRVFENFDLSPLK